MRPDELQPNAFAAYPPEAEAIATREIRLLRKLPISFLPLLLRELIDYDWKFPAERAELDHQFSFLDSQSASQINSLMLPFASLRISPDLLQLDWVSEPVQFSEKLSASLWATQQMEAFRRASIDYVHQVALARPEPKPGPPRVSIVFIGQGVGANQSPLFQNLRKHGVYRTNVGSGEAYAAVLEFLANRARQHPAPFGHWYVDGHRIDRELPGVSAISYSSLEPARATLINKMVQTMKPGGGGPEQLRTDLAAMNPSEVGLPTAGSDALLSRFKLALLTQGSGTQMFSTTFVQWAAREILRRAQPATLFIRFAPRQKEATVRPEISAISTDPAASLVDADMGAYYTWINNQRLSGSEASRFLVLFEGHKDAFVAAPSVTRGTIDDQPVQFSDLIARLA